MLPAIVKPPLIFADTDVELGEDRALLHSAIGGIDACEFLNGHISIADAAAAHIGHFGSGAVVVVHQIISFRFYCRKAFLFYAAAGKCDTEKSAELSSTRGADNVELE